MSYIERVNQAADRFMTMQSRGVGSNKMNLQSLALVFCVKECDIINAAQHIIK